MGSDSLKTQALKILVNLSCNSDMVPHLLAAKVCMSHVIKALCFLTRYLFPLVNRAKTF